MGADDRLRLDYEQTTQLMRTLTDIRFKLLAFVPTIAGASVGFAGRSQSAGVLLAVGLIGLSATTGIFLYELRNSQLFDTVVARAELLEQRLGLTPTIGSEGPGGLFTNRPRRTLTLFGALAGWIYLVVWGALHAVHVGGARQTGAIVGVVVGVAVVAEVERLGRLRERAAT